MNDRATLDHLHSRLSAQLSILYPDHDSPDHDIDALADRIIDLFWPDRDQMIKREHIADKHLWDESDIALITYGGTIRSDGEKPLHSLHRFLRTHIGQTIGMVHILPFFPYSSDDGFAVIDYLQVDEALGDWSDIETIAGDYRLMADLVINHGSSKSTWFQQFLSDQAPGKDYYYTADPAADLGQVVRPRSHPLLTPFRTAAGDRNVWSTFSADQLDFDFTNPDLLCEFVKIIADYIAHGVRIFRLDAIAFLWKKIGTPSINLDETHEVIRLLRTLMDHHAETLIIITETNIPNHENLTYFGNQNEAHVIYNFSLPPLLVHALLTGDALYLKRLTRSNPPALTGCTYLNFTASHDGIGLRPTEGVLPQGEVDQMLTAIQGFGGRLSMRRGPGGTEKPYEMNISYFEAMQGTLDGPDDHQIDRFMAAMAIMLSLEGIPAIYIHSLLATPNGYEEVNLTGQNRSINRRRLDYDDISDKLDNPGTVEATVFNRFLGLIEIRKKQSAFHPNAVQFTLALPEGLFGIWRQSQDRKQSIFAVTNVTNGEKILALADINLIAGDVWWDLISGQAVADIEGDFSLSPYQSVWITNVKPQLD
ncbi:sugar phosphorylase [Parasphingorhabdus cellanae]|uniref:Sugar phosphorylase n=1 Tax=Parasphingorhabdus cellanae TaxID=2806553 RepID=A0ABX7T7N2_9SPHN|nr:sugar phosphorylase [Parasphingorhabdus cellanae]QTD57619.1 sugar phosphorylase [Parasphingorhabdus cellanae]